MEKVCSVPPAAGHAGASSGKPRAVCLILLSARAWFTSDGFPSSITKILESISLQIGARPTNQALNSLLSKFFTSIYAQHVRYPRHALASYSIILFKFADQPVSFCKASRQTS